MNRKKVIYIGLMLIIMIFAGITYYSYGFMVKDFEYHGKINIIAGTIDYKLVSSELNSNNQITLLPNTTKEFDIEIVSLNTIDSTYKLYYETSSNYIEVGYTNNTEDNPSGNITSKSKKKVHVVVRNNSNKVNGTVTFGCQGGLLNYELILSEGRTLLTEKNLYKEDLLNGADPVLTTNLVPVTISNTGVVTKASVFSEWYNYEDKEWANIVKLKSTASDYSAGSTIPESAIESYFVWIPKYSYQLFYLTGDTTYSETDYTDPVNGKNPINIRFGLTNTNDSNTGECTTPMTEGNIGNCQEDDYMTHPAFIAMNSNGLWVGKFETGYDGATTVGQAQQETANKDKVIIKPNVYSWRNINVGNIFKTSIEYMPSEDSHMMKNTEWGAMAYLTNSVYGTCTENTCLEVRINNNRNFITGYAGTEQPTQPYNGGTSIEGNRNEGTNLGVDGTYTINYLNTDSQVASTTQNYTGIYDTSGGSWEYVAGFTIGNSSDLDNITTSDSSNITTLYTNFYSNSNYSKYWDKYTSTANTHWNKRILGDATGELGPFIYTEDLDLNSQGTAYNRRLKSNWYHDYAFFVTSSSPWFGRGGFWSLGIEAGPFAFIYDAGGAISTRSFRIVLSPTE